MDQRLTTSLDTLNGISNVQINEKVFTESEKNEILVAAVKCFMGETQGGCFWGEQNCQPDFRGR